MTRTHHRGLGPSVAVAGLLFMVGCTKPVPDWCSIDAGPTRVIASEGLPVAELTETWRLDGNAPGNELLGPVSAAIHPTTRQLAISDSRLAEVVRISPEGILISRWGPQGSGPGEIQVPTAVAWAESGGLLVFDPVNQKTVLLRQGEAPVDAPVDREFAGFITSQSLMWMDLSPDREVIGVPAPPTYGPPERELALVTWTPTTSRIDTLMTATVPTVRPEGYTALLAPLWAAPVGAASPTTNRYALAGDTPKYRVRVLDADRETVFQICRDIDAMPIADQELAVSPDLPQADMVATVLKEAPQPVERARIGRLSYDADGRLWVQRDRPSPVSSLDWTLGWRCVRCVFRRW